MGQKDVLEPDMTALREALEVSWRQDTAYLGVAEDGTPALGQCYPTSRVVQYYLPQTEIVQGLVETPKGTEEHFWNILIVRGVVYHIDFTWQQFPLGSVVKEYKIRDRATLGDSPATVRRVELLRGRVEIFLKQNNPTSRFSQRA